MGNSLTMSVSICGSVSDQPQVVAVPVRRDLRRDEGEGAPLVDRNENSTRVLLVFSTYLYKRSTRYSHATRYSNITSISHVHLVSCVEHPSVMCPCHVPDRTVPMSSYYYYTFLEVSL